MPLIHHLTAGPLRLAVAVSLLVVPVASATVHTVPSPETPTIGSALDLATAGDSVNVLPGTYFEHGLTVPAFVTLRGVAGASETIVDAEGMDQVLFLRSSAMLEGLTITGGAAFRAAGVETYGHATVRSCVITNNHATARGGGMATLEIASPTVIVEGTVFSNNSAGEVGGGLQAEHAVLTLSGCVFEGNSAPEGGGANFWFVFDTIVTGCLFTGNTADRGGGVHLGDGTISVEACTFHGNSATLGGAIYEGGVHSAEVSRSIIAFNAGPPVSCTSATSDTPYSCCNFFANTGGDTFCGIQGVGNFSLDPFFCDAANGDFRIDESSPCLPGNHPAGVDCGGAIGAFGIGCGVATSIETRVEAAPWSLVKARYR